MILDVDATSPVPPFEQLRAQLHDMILAGSLPAGHRLPPIRQLAADLGLAPGTVARVYKELEASGLVASRVRYGTVVIAPSKPRATAVRAKTEDASRAFVLNARRLGLSLDDALSAVRREWDTLDAPGQVD